MSCLTASVQLPLNAQGQVATSLRPRASVWPLQRPCSSQSISFCVKKKWIQPAGCAPPRRQQLRATEEAYTDNFFVEVIRDIQNGITFLCEQPRELQYLEFPSLQSAAKMAIFTIAVVMVLIVFLATVDSAFSYIMASMFRRIK